MNRNRYESNLSTNSLANHSPPVSYLNNNNYNHVNNKPGSTPGNSHLDTEVHKAKRTHHRSRSVDLRLSSSSSSPLSPSKNSLREHFLASIEEKVARIYYRHGLFCSRHPFLVILLSLLLVAISSYPIFTFRGIFGSSSEVYMSSQSPTNHYSYYNSQNDKLNVGTLDVESSSDSLLNHLYFWKNSKYTESNTNNQHSIPRWFQPNLSYAYVQQIFVRSAVIPWTSELQLVDALRGPFSLIFELIESISNYQSKNNLTEDINLSDVCFQVFEPTLSKRYSHLNAHLPSYSCLVLSPANVWNGDSTKFLQDSKFLATLLKFQDKIPSPLPSGAMHDIFFGVQFEETGIRRTYGRNRVRTITYSITLILRKNVPSFIEGLRSFLYTRYPFSNSNSINHTSQNDEPNVVTNNEETLHIFYHKTFTQNYLIPLALCYTLVCFYMYFSVRKIELVRNKFLYALCAFITVLLSLFMSFGICFRLRFNNSVLIVNRLLPYFVAGISFENMFVLTKSVLAIPHLDTKVRVAQGLSKEGLSITKNLLAELTLLTIGSLTFAPFFQECCIFAAVCLISDYFIQVTFFTAFFSIDIQRINERSINSKFSPNKLLSAYPKNIYAEPGKPVKQKTPKRLRFIYFLARIRLVQRGFILLLCACIGLAIYNAYLVLDQPLPNSSESDFVVHNINNTKHRFTGSSTTPLPSHLNPNSQKEDSFNFDHKHSNQVSNQDSSDLDLNDKQHSLMELLKSTSSNSSESESPEDPISAQTSSRLSHISANPHNQILFTRKHLVPQLANYHWANLFFLYNISLVGRFISILPPILLSIPVNPDKAISVRNIADSNFENLQKFVPMKFSNGEYVISDDDDYDTFENIHLKAHFFSTWSNKDIYITIGLSIPSFIFFIYIFIVLYRCVCTRNYAEWRSQLSSNINPLQFVRMNSLLKFASSGVDEREQLFRFNISLLNVDREKESYLNENQFLLHNQDIDVITANVQSSLVATASMSGDIRVYDALSCETLSYIKRSVGVVDYYDQSTAKTTNNNESSNVVANSSFDQACLVAQTSGSVLKTIVCGISVENDNDDEPVLTGENQGEHRIDASFKFRPIWCLDIFDRYILAGCGGEEGRLEVWDAYTGQLEFIHYPDHFNQDMVQSDNLRPSNAAITMMRVTYWGVVLARLSGVLDLVELAKNKDDNYSTFSNIFNNKDISPSSSSSKTPSVRCRLIHSLHAHQQPIARLEIIDSLEDEEFIKTFGSRGCLITGSVDTTLKVFSLDNARFIYTLNGHCGAIMTTAIDQFSTATALSGCQLGQLCVWDLNTGTCIFSMQAHSQAEVLAITSSPLYYVSTGTDSRICIWDRYSGHLVHSISNHHSNCRSMMFLESHILITVRDNELVVWDVNDARQLCIISLSNNNRDCKEDKNMSWIKSYQTTSIKNILFAHHRKALVCDYGNSLCVINNPFATKKLD